LRYRIKYHDGVDASTLLRHLRERAGLTLRGLAAAAHTSHSALAAYEAGRVAPSVGTFERIAVAAGFTVAVTFERRIADDTERSRELIDALELAAQFPARHDPLVECPIFPVHAA
jgi:transcriptional regulator with XRE-family HTH domain